VIPPLHWQSKRWLPSAFNSAAVSRSSTQRVAASSHRHRSMKGAHSVFAVTSGIALLEEETPSSYSEAMLSNDRDKWRTAAQLEFDGCVAQKTWVLVKRSDLPVNTNIIPVKWVFKIKTDENGVVTKYKARITPKGFRQRHGIDYFEVFANTGKYKTLRVLLSIVARRNLELHQYDVPQAFTQAELDEDVFMEMPEGFEIEGMVCHLKKSLYGLKQSPRNWYLLISQFLIQNLGFQATVSDPCLFWKKGRASGQMILLFLFVDDMQVAFEKIDEEEWNEDHRKLKKRFNITDLGASKFMLGMHITRDRGARTIKLDQELYITKALEKFGLHECKSAPTPATVVAATPDRKSGSESDQLTDVKLYQEKVGTLLYAAISTRPDIAFAVNKVTQHMQSPTVVHAKACDRIFRYLADTKLKGMLFGRRCGESTKSHRDLMISAYADADWGSDPTDRKSITGWIVMIDSDPVSWACKKQKVVSQSSCEAELYAEAAAINEIKWLSGLLGEIGMIRSVSPKARLHHDEMPTPPILYGDNQSTQELSRNGIKSERTKHIDIKYRFVTDEITNGRVQLKWIPTTKQVADVLTKALGIQQHRTLVDRLMIQ
jgi:hypothetical protein